MQRRNPFVRLLFSAFALGIVLGSAPSRAGQKPKEWNPTIDPANFVSTVDNPYFPLTPGRKMRYADGSGVEALVVEVTNRSKMVMGVRTTVVIETVTENGQVVEISENWFAQDRNGNVWYFGEDSQDFQDGAPVSKAGSWEAGVGDALPGIMMKADPASGDTYFQEYAPGVAEDMASVQSASETTSTRLGPFSYVLKTKEWTSLEPSSVEHKYYAPGVGLIREEHGNERLELMAVE